MDSQPGEQRDVSPLLVRRLTCEAFVCIAVCDFGTPTIGDCDQVQLRMRDIRFAQVDKFDIPLVTWPVKKQGTCPIIRRICWSLKIGFERTRIAALTWKGFVGRLVFVAHVVVMPEAGRPVARDFGSVRNAITRHR